MNKKLFILLLMGCMTYLHAQNSPFSTGANTFNYASDSIKFSGIIGESYLGDHTILSVGGNEYTVGFPYRMMYTEDAFKGDLFASKGYYSDYVKLQWEIFDPEKVTQIKIFRRDLSLTDDAYRLVNTLASTANSWQDEYAEPGQMYKYKVLADGVWEEEIYGLNVVEGVGFRVTSATVTGRITYTGGNIVSGVKVKVEPDIPTKGGLYNYTFPNVVNGNHLLVRPQSHADFSEGVTVQAWVKPQLVSGKTSYPIFSVGTSLSLTIEDISNKHFFGIYMGEQMALSALLTDSILSEYMQVSLVWNQAISKALLYLNGNLYFEHIFNDIAVGNANWYIGGRVADSNTSTFSGLMDEVRLWNHPMSKDEVYETFDTYISPNDTKLAGYWKMDEGGGKEIYDISRLNNNFNENHAVEISQNYDYADNFSQEIPSQKRLGYKAVTDANGNYVVAGIAYASGGSYYSVVASKGVHQFDPSDKLLYISKEASVFNNVDFTDISSFKLQGSVYYEGTKYPVSDVYVKVDGNYVVDSKKQPIKTGADGFFDIDVPIGEHYISVHKNGHQFASDYWPSLDENGNPTFFDFQDDYVYSPKFEDVTKVKLVGRIVGGPIEAAKPIGSKVNQSKNNLGVVNITLTTEKGVDLWNDKPDVTESTDPKTGEFVMELIPEKFILKNDLAIKNDLYTFNRDEDKTILDLSFSFNTMYTIDSVFSDTIIDEEKYIYFDYLDTVLEYNYHRDWIWRSTPEISVISDNDSLFWGMEEYEYAFSDDSSEMVPLVTMTSDTTFNYEFGYPVFRQRDYYGLKISAIETYTNADNDSVDKVPVTDGAIVVENELANDNKEETIALDENGEAVHEFMGGMPLTASPYRKNMSFKLKIDGAYVSGAEVLESCYLFGAKPSSGMNFVTGPDEVDFILRDPPGSNSYAYFEEGFTTSKTTTESYTNGFGGDIDVLHMFGVKLTTEVGGLGFAMETEVETENTLGLSTSNEFMWNNDRSYSESKSYMFSYSTSDDPAYVGEMGDVFFGHGTNIFYGAATNVRLLRESGHYQVGTNRAVMIGKEATTDFVYTYNHIENYLIPDLIKLRNELFDSIKYTSHLPVDDERYGMANDDPIFNNAAVEETEDYIDGYSYKFMPQEGGDDVAEDKVNEYNKMIKNWQRILAENEALKLTATGKFDEDNSFSNLSFDAGASIESAVTVEEAMERSNTYEWSIDVGVALELGFTVNKFGMKVVAQERYHHDGSGSQEYEDEKSKTIGFVLADGDQGDYFSVDVKKDIFFDAPVFLLKGGQSSCPYEGGEKTKYLTQEMKPYLLDRVDTVFSNKYIDLSWEDKIDLMDEGDGSGDDDQMTFEDLLGEYDEDDIDEMASIFRNLSYRKGVEITKGTMKIESPEITTPESTVANVPEGSEAIFTVYLSNTSEVGADNWFGLFADAASNPDGAIIHVDGQPLVGGVSILVPAGETVAKTITVQKGRDEVNDYNDLAIIIHSLCQFDPTDDIDDISDTVLLSASFIPSCTEVKISQPLNQWIVNTSNKKLVSGKYELPLKFEGYDLNYSSFNDFMFQYKPSEQSSWITAQTFINGASGLDTTDIGGKAFVNYVWDMTSLQNRAYDLRAISHCSDGSVYASEVLKGIFDNKPPKVFGTPSPADGILSIDDELMLSFDEDIQAGLIGKANISVTGVTNGTDLRYKPYLLHDVSLHFDGVKQSMEVPQNINLKHTSFTIEFWAKRNRLGQECLLAQGNPNNGGLWLGFDANNHFIATVNGQTVYSNNTYEKRGVWNHYAFVFDNTIGVSGNEISLIIASGDETDIANKTIQNSYYGDAPISIGYCSSNNTAFNGNVHSLHLWNQNSTSSDITARRYRLLNGYEKGLIGAWTMKDAHGRYVKDIAFDRDGIVDATWSVSKQGSSLDCGQGAFMVNTSTLELTSDADFTLEFWYKAEAPQSDTVYLFSNGVSAYREINDKWNLMAIPAEALVLSNDKVSFEIDDLSSLDNNWHHFALSVNRRGNMNVYIDGNLKMTSSATQVSGFGSDKCVFGARYLLVDASSNDYDSYAFATFDEVRIWNSAKTQSMIVDSKNYALTGAEKGLKLYLPFEDVNVSDPSVNNQTLKNMTIDSLGVADDCSLFNAASFSLETPSIKLAKPISDIPFEYVINGNRVLITPAIDDNFIENSMLNVALEGAYDKAGNRMSMTAEWQAFVNRNQLLWEHQSVDLQMNSDEKKEFVIHIFNKGGTPELWQINNLPVWITADVTEGTLDPLSMQAIVFTIHPAVNPGNYSHDIYLSGSMAYNERCKINLLVEKAAPNWSVKSEMYENSLVLIGRLKIAGEFSTDVNDKVAAFDGNECRGVAQVQHYADRDIYLVNLTAYGNSGEKLHLRVWDASKGNVHTGVTPSVVFVANDIIGSPSNPELILTTDSVAVEIPIKAGWNWLSFNLQTSQLEYGDKLFASLSSAIDDIVKTKDDNDTYAAQGWGNEMAFSTERMYKLKNSYDGVLRLSGVPENATAKTITLNHKWNWISYVPQYKMPIVSALSYHSPAQDDVIKSQTKFAMYDAALGWIGSLQYMRPFEGYMYHSQSLSTVSFKYPQETLLNKSTSLTEEASVSVSNAEHTMTAMISLVNSPFGGSEQVKLVTMCGNKVVGEARAINELYYPMSIGGSSEVMSLSFILVNETTGESLPANEVTNYAPNKILGSASQPFELTFNIEDAGSVMVSPNPFQKTVNINHIPEDVHRIEIYDMQGRTIYQWTNVETSSLQWNGVAVDGRQAINGIYLLKMFGQGYYAPQKLIKE